jgi:hypothetical protein
LGIPASALRDHVRPSRGVCDPGWMIQGHQTARCQSSCAASHRSC